MGPQFVLIGINITLGMDLPSLSLVVLLNLPDMDL